MVKRKSSVLDESDDTEEERVPASSTTTTTTTTTTSSSADDAEPEKMKSLPRGKGKLKRKSGKKSSSGSAAAAAAAAAAAMGSASSLSSVAAPTAGDDLRPPRFISHGDVDNDADEDDIEESSTEGSDEAAGYNDDLAGSRGGDGANQWPEDGADDDSLIEEYDFYVNEDSWGRVALIQFPLRPDERRIDLYKEVVRARLKSANDERSRPRLELTLRTNPDGQYYSKHTERKWDPSEVRVFRSTVSDQSMDIQVGMVDEETKTVHCFPAPVRFVMHPYFRRVDRVNNRAAAAADDDNSAADDRGYGGSGIDDDGSDGGGPRAGNRPSLLPVSAKGRVGPVSVDEFDRSSSTTTTSRSVSAAAARSSTSTTSDKSKKKDGVVAGSELVAAAARAEAEARARLYEEDDDFIGDRLVADLDDEDADSEGWVEFEFGPPQNNDDLKSPLDLELDGAKEAKEFCARVESARREGGNLGAAMCREAHQEFLFSLAPLLPGRRDAVPDLGSRQAQELRKGRLLAEVKAVLSKRHYTRFSEIVKLVHTPCTENEVLDAAQQVAELVHGLWFEKTDETVYPDAYAALRQLLLAELASIDPLAPGNTSEWLKSREEFAKQAGLRGQDPLVQTMFLEISGFTGPDRGWGLPEQRDQAFLNKFPALNQEAADSWKRRKSSLKSRAAQFKKQKK